MSRFLELIVDGTNYKVGVEFGSLDRSFELMEGNGATTAMSGYSIRDLIGTNTEYSMIIHSLPGKQSDYDNLYEVLTSPVDSHTFKLDNNGVIEEFEAQIESGDDEYLGFEDGVHHWDNLSVTFKPIVPQEIYEYGSDTPQPTPIDPSKRTMGDIVVTTIKSQTTGETFHTANGTASMDCNFYYSVNTKYMQRGKYAFACCPANGSNSTYSVTIFTAGSTYTDIGEGVLFNYDGESSLVYSINIGTGMMVNNMVFSPVFTLREAENDLVDYVENIDETYAGLNIVRSADWNSLQINGVSRTDVSIPLSLVYNTETFPNGKYVFGAFSPNSGASSTTFYVEVICDDKSYYDYGAGIVFKALRSNPTLSYVLHIKANENIDAVVFPTLNKTYDDETIEDIYERNGLTITTSYLSGVDILRISVTGTATADTTLEIPYYNSYLDQGEYWFSNGGSYDNDYDNSKLCYTSLVIGEDQDAIEYTISQNAVNGIKYPNARRFNYDGNSKIVYKMFFKQGYKHNSEFVYTAHVYKIDTSVNYITSLVTTSGTNNGITVTKANSTTYSVSGTAGGSDYAIVPINLAYVPITNAELIQEGKNAMVLVSGCPQTAFAPLENDANLYCLQATVTNPTTTLQDYGFGFALNSIDSGATFSIAVTPSISVDSALFSPALNKMYRMHTGRYKQYGLLFTALVYQSGYGGVVVSGMLEGPPNSPYVFYPDIIGDGLDVIDASNLTGNNLYFSASPPNASADTYYSAILVNKNDGSNSTWYYDYGRGVTVPLNSTYSYRWVILVQEGTTIQSIMFKPSIESSDMGADIVGQFNAYTSKNGINVTLPTSKQNLIINGTSTSYLAGASGGCKVTGARNKCYLLSTDFPYILRIDYGAIANQWNSVSIDGSGGILSTIGNDIAADSLVTMRFYFDVPYGKSINTNFRPVVSQIPKTSMNGVDNWYATLADGTKAYLINGSAVLDATFTYSYTKNLGSAGEFHAFGCPLLGSDGTYYIVYNIGTDSYYDYGEGVNFNYNGIDQITYTIVIKAGTEMVNRYFAPTIVKNTYNNNYIYDINYRYFKDNSNADFKIYGDRFICNSYSSPYGMFYKKGRCSIVISSLSSGYIHFKLLTYQAGYYEILVASPETDATDYVTELSFEPFNDTSGQRHTLNLPQFTGKSSGKFYLEDGFIGGYFRILTTSEGSKEMPRYYDLALVEFQD